MSVSHCLPSPRPRFNLLPWQSISREFSVVDHTVSNRPEPALQKMVQSPLSGTTQPVDSEEEDQCLTIDRQWVK